MDNRIGDTLILICLGAFMLLVTILLFAPCIIISLGLYRWMAG